MNAQTPRYRQQSREDLRSDRRPPSRGIESGIQKPARPRDGARTFFIDPRTSRPIAPRPVVKANKYIDDGTIPVAWTDSLTRPVTLTTLDTNTARLEMNLQGNNMDELYGSVSIQPRDIKSHGVHKLANGQFNQLWRVSAGKSFLSLFPAEIKTKLSDDAVVIRAPLMTTDSVSKTELAGEISNVLTAAVHGYGVLVGGMTWIRTIDYGQEEALGEGQAEVKYRLISFLERADMSVDKRLGQIYGSKRKVPGWHIFTSRQTTGFYFDSLLRCIYLYSVERCVHLDSTLRNFVDFVGNRALPIIKLIDIDDTVFRRLHCSDSAPSDAWKLIWLFNVLYVSCFLKTSLYGLRGIGGGSGAGILGSGAGYADPFHTFFYDKIREPVNAVIDIFLNNAKRDPDFELCKLFLTDSFWEGCAPNYSQRDIPIMSEAPYCGNSPAAVANSALSYAYYYFTIEPFKEIDQCYSKPCLEYFKRKQESRPDAQRLHDSHKRFNEAVVWFDTHAARVLVPMARFWFKACHSGTRTPLVILMARFVSTPFHVLERDFGRNVGRGGDHTVDELVHLREHLLKF